MNIKETIRAVYSLQDGECYGGQRGFGWVVNELQSSLRFTNVSLTPVCTVESTQEHAKKN